MNLKKTMCDWPFKNLHYFLCGLWPFFYFFAASAAADENANAASAAASVTAAAEAVSAAAEAAKRYLQGAGIRTRDTATADRWATLAPKKLYYCLPF